MIRRRLFALAAVATTFALIACGVEGTVLREIDDETEGGPSADATANQDADGTLDSAGDARNVFPADAAHGDATGIFTGQYFSCGITAGLASCWGSNLTGQLGTGSLQNQLAPTSVADSPGFTVLSAGEEHACGVAYGTGALYCWGSDSDGQLGQGQPVATLDASPPDPTPLLVSLAHPAVKVGAGYEHTCAIVSDGSLWCWGENYEGELGQNDAFNSANISSPARVGTSTDWRDVSGGQGNTCGIRAASGTSGTLWCWGRNTASELGLGTGQPKQIRTPTQVGTETSWAQVEIGQDIGCAVRIDGTLWCWGDGFGQLPADAGTILYSPTQIGGDTDWAQVNTDTFVTCGLKTSGALFCWGRNVEGELGTGDTTDRTAPTATGGGAAFTGISVGRFHTCARTTAGVLECSGDNESGQLGVGDVDRRNVFTPIAN